MTTAALLTLRLLRPILLCLALCGGTAAAATTTETPAELAAAVGRVLRNIETAPAGHYSAQNIENRLALNFDGDSLQLAPIDKQNSWRWGLRLTGYGSAGAVRAVEPGSVATNAHRLEYRRGSVTEWYENRAEGIEQGFTLNQPPQDGSDDVELRLGLSGNLAANLDADRHGAQLFDQAGHSVLGYRNLSVIDAQGKTLPAQLALADQVLSIRVDARGAAWPIVVDPLIVSEQAKLTEPVPAQNNEFGYSVAIDRDTAVIGMPALIGGATVDTGVAYVFVRSGKSWSLQAKLAATNGQSGDNFGYSVAISGNTAIMGAPATVLRTGAAYVFVRTGTTWSQQAKLTTTDSASAVLFGRSVAMAGDTAVVGSPMATQSGLVEAGNAYVFTRSGTVWSQQAKLSADDAQANSNFGNALALAGNTLVVGAANADINATYDAGAAYVFERIGGVWSQQAKLTASDGKPEDNFGYSVAISGNTVVAGVPQADGIGNESPGMGAVYVFERNATAWNQQAKLTAAPEEPDSLLGHAVAIDGDLLVAGSPYATAAGKMAAGAAYVFERNGTVWTQARRLTASQIGEGDDEQYGSAVAISRHTAVVGVFHANIGDATSAGAAYVYTLHPTLTVIPPVGGSVASEPDGIDCGSYCSATFVLGSNVVLTATPAAGYAFAGWSGCTSSNAAVCTVNMTADTTVSASFVPTYSLLVTVVDPMATGTVTSNPAGIDCGASCNSRFADGTALTLTASPASAFESWNGACSGGANPCSLTMTTNRTVTATFKTPPNTNSKTLTVTKTGQGSLASSPGGIDCGATCSSTFAEGSSVTLTATPVAGYVFAGWSGCTSSSGASCTVEMTANRTVTASFNPSASSNSKTLTVTKTGLGSIASLSGGISCGTTCSTTFVEGSSVTLTATPAAGYAFAGWSGCASSSANSCTVDMTADKTVSATFVQVVALTVSKTGLGTVVSVPTVIDCGTACSAQLGKNTTITLAAIAADGYKFAGWSGACSGKKLCKLKLNKNKAVKAKFVMKKN